MKGTFVEVSTQEEPRQLISLYDEKGANILLSLTPEQVKLLNWLEENGWLYNGVRAIAFNPIMDAIVL